MVCPKTIGYFNSIKVRLNLGADFVYRTKTSFQFHKGTIKPGTGRAFQHQAQRRFQFHKGTIKPPTKLENVADINISIP